MFFVCELKVGFCKRQFFYHRWIFLLFFHLCFRNEFCFLVCKNLFLQVFFLHVCFFAMFFFFCKELSFFFFAKGFDLFYCKGRLFVLAFFDFFKVFVFPEDFLFFFKGVCFYQGVLFFFYSREFVFLMRFVFPQTCVFFSLVLGFFISKGFGLFNQRVLDFFKGVRCVLVFFPRDLFLFQRGFCFFCLRVFFLEGSVFFHRFFFLKKFSNKKEGVVCFSKR